MTESEIQKQILDYLRWCKVYAWRNNSRSVKVGGRLIHFGKVGSADILGILKPTGRLLAIEVKKAGGKVSPEQQAFLDAITDAGGLSIIAYSVDDVRRILFPV